MLPTVTTAISPGATSRDTMVCSRTTIMAVSTTGSMEFCGRAPWAPRPYTVTLMLSSVAINGPGRVATVPAIPGSRCWASATSGVGMRLSRPSSTMPWAPSPVSSAGWNRGEQRPVPPAGGRGHELGHAGQAGHVHIVAAGMGHRHLVTVGILDRHGARVVRAGVLLDRKAVQFGPEQHGGAVTVGQDADHPGAADAGLDREAVLLKLVGNPAGCPMLLVGQLGMGVQILIERFLGGL